MSTPYQLARDKIKLIDEHRQAKADELRRIPGIVADGIARAIGAPAHVVLVGLVDIHRVFKAGAVDQQEEFVNFSIKVDFGASAELGLDQSYDIEVNRSGLDYQIFTDGEAPVTVGVPFEDFAPEIAQFAKSLGMKIMSDISRRLPA